MEIEKYYPSKTVKKAVLPVSILLLVNIVLSLLKQSEINVPNEIVWQAALAGYGAIITLMNYIKNHKRGKATSA